MKLYYFLVNFACHLLLFAVLGCSALEKGVCFWAASGDDCMQNQFQCHDGTCIDREFYCDGRYDCDDNSDEDYCQYVEECYSTYFRKCEMSDKCIPAKWFCDKVSDCPFGEDENCDEVVAKEQALHWLKRQRMYRSATDVWGPNVARTAVAFYLGDALWRNFNDGTRSEMSYELSIQLLSRLSQEKLENIPSNDLASYINAFLVTCLDPWQFHGHDIVGELRSRVDRQNYTNPYLLLALCNAGDTMDTDVMKLQDVYDNKRRPLWTDMKALAVMALACINRSRDDLDVPDLSYLIEGLWTEATDNLQTKALVIQALISINSNSLLFNDTEVLQRVITSQNSDGSFGNIINTYYILPILNCQSLVDINSDHCKAFYKNDNLTLDEMDNKGPRITVSYSIQLGYDGAFTRTLILKVPNMTLFELMKHAAVLDDHRLEYTYQHGKPYINAIDGKQDDPEKGKFWFLYDMRGEKPVVIHDSPGEIILADGDSYLMWYHDEIWTS